MESTYQPPMQCFKGIIFGRLRCSPKQCRLRGLADAGPYEVVTRVGPDEGCVGEKGTESSWLGGCGGCAQGLRRRA
jgi:hypothetical protein